MSKSNFLHIDTKNFEEKDETGKKNIQNLNDSIKDGKTVFLLIYMEGCGPCNATRPEWKKLENVLNDDILNNDVLIVDMDKDLLEKVNNIGTSPKGFPTIRYISNKDSEDFEDSELSDEDKNRNVDSFVKWIELKSKKGGKGLKGGKRRTTRKMMKRGKRRMSAGKWSKKYKKSINCNRPKGFSQKQYCKYSRKRR
jgi:thiol-disulfide isomerase/thioredoxin